MKKLIALISIILFNISCLKAQAPGTITDIDGNVYRTVTTGKFVWMAENLRVTKYNNGMKIPFVTNDTLWAELNSGAYCWYDNNEDYRDTYGALYNWYTVSTGDLCPVGWRVPTDEEWKYLEGYADSVYKIGNMVWNKAGLRGFNAGKRLKALKGWRQGNNGPDDFGFSALPAGERLHGFNNMAGRNGFWWTSTENNSASAWYRCIIYSFDEVSRDIHPKQMGFSVRCLKDK